MVVGGDTQGKGQHTLSHTASIPDFRKDLQRLSPLENKSLDIPSYHTRFQWKARFLWYKVELMAPLASLVALLFGLSFAQHVAQFA